MTAPRIDQANRIVADVRAALDAADLADVTATINAALIESGSRDGIVVVSPPALTFDGTFSDVQTAFELHVIAGPPDNYLHAWERIDTIIQALVDAQLNLRDGKPGGFEPRAGLSIPAYTLTMNDVE